MLTVGAERASGLHLAPLLAQTLIGNRHFGAQLLGKQRHAIFLQPPAIQLQLRVALAFLGMFVQAVLVLRPQAAQLSAPHSVLLHLAGQFLQAQLNGLEETWQFLEPLRRCFPHKTWVHQMAQLLLDVIQGHRLGQVDLALEALLQAMPQLQHFQRQAGQALGVLGPAAALAFSQGRQTCTVTRQAGFAFQYAGVETGQQNVFNQCIDALVEDILLASLDSCVLEGEASLPRDGAGLAALAERKRGSWTEHAERLARLTLEVLKLWHGLQKRFKGKIDLAQAVALNDIKQQLSNLVYPGFVRETPAQWFKELPRFLKAIELRLEKLPSQVQKDRVWSTELGGLWAQYQNRLNKHTQEGKRDPQLELYRWWLEEYRVSLFAQQLGTKVPISDKRLSKQWSLVEA